MDVITLGIQGEEERCVRHPQCPSRIISGHDPFQIITLHFPSILINIPSVTFKEMIEQWFSFDRVCELCGSSTERRTVIQHFPQILFILFVLFHANKHRASRPISGYVTNNIVISGHRYHTIVAICHSGTSTRSGHYCVCCNKETNR